MSKTSRILTLADLRTPAWSRVKAQLDEDIAEARAKLEIPDLDHNQTQFQRGRIAALKQMLEYERALAEEPRRRKARADFASNPLGQDDGDGIEP